MRLSRRGVLTGGPALLAARSAYAADYDPTTPGPQSRAADHHYDRVIHDASRQRDIPVQIRHSARRIRMPVILFSHGLGGSRHGSEYLERWWTARGYVTVFLQHPGSDDAVWRNTPPDERMAALRAATRAAEGGDLRDADLAALVRSAARPGLVSRVRRYVESLKPTQTTQTTRTAQAAQTVQATAPERPAAETRAQ